MAPGLCIGRGSLAMAQATHGSAPDIAGKGIANPYAMIESTRMLLDWLGRAHGLSPAIEAAAAMRQALDAALADPATRTPDIAGRADLAGMTDAILKALAGNQGKHTHAEP
jgi:3-isopropylmalate dehydrogenase